jgi:hypothetical protein
LDIILRAVSIAAFLGVYGDRSVVQNTFLSSGYVWQYIYIYIYIHKPFYLCPSLLWEE